MIIELILGEEVGMVAAPKILGLFIPLIVISSLVSKISEFFLNFGFFWAPGLLVVGH